MATLDRKKSIGGQVLNLYKKLGETPRERLDRLRKENPQFEFEVLSYAGRLDPMAEGVLLCLVGSANARHEEYLDLSKEYTLDILFGFSTDTYDILGRVMEYGDSANISRKMITENLGEFRGRFEQEYPPFSSKTIDGKSLFQWARENMLGGVALPRREVIIYRIELTKTYKVSEPDLFSYIEDSINKVGGDFRQEEILTLWRRHLRKEGTREFPCATIQIACSSGTYARSIAHGLGQQLGIPALALHILRTKVGEHTIDKSLK